jgi:hypothetical protein
MTIKSLVCRVSWLLLLLFALGLTFFLMHHLTLLFLALSDFFQFLGLHDNMVESERFDLCIVDIRIGCIAVAAEGSHAGNYHQKHPSVSEVRGHFLYLNLVEFAYPLM